MKKIIALFLGLIFFEVCAYSQDTMVAKIYLSSAHTGIEIKISGLTKEEFDVVMSPKSKNDVVQIVTNKRVLGGFFKSEEKKTYQFSLRPIRTSYVVSRLVQASDDDLTESRYHVERTTVEATTSDTVNTLTAFGILAAILNLSFYVFSIFINILSHKGEGAKNFLKFLRNLVIILVLYNVAIYFAI